MSLNSHSLDLKGINYAFITDAAQIGLDLSGDFTIEGWVKPRAGTGEFCICSKYGSAGQRSYSFNYDVDNTGLVLRISFDGTSYTSTGTVSADLGNVWHHVAVVRTATTSKVQLFVDGAPLSAPFILTGTNLFNGTEQFRIGAHADGANYMDGLVDDVRVWNIARTAVDIANDYGREILGTTAGLVGYWKLNNDHTDETNNNNDLTPAGGPPSQAFTSELPFPIWSPWGAGAFGLRGFGVSSLALPARAARPITPPATVTELRRLWGRDIFFDGDYAVNPAGDWLVVDREKALKQAVVRRIITAPGEWRTLPEYGIGARLFVKAPKTPAVLAELKDRIRTQLPRDPRIASVERVDLETGTDLLKVSVKIIPRASAEHAKPLLISVEVT